MKQEELNEKKAKKQRIEDDQAGNVTGGSKEGKGILWDALTGNM